MILGTGRKPSSIHERGWWFPAKYAKTKKINVFYGKCKVQFYRKLSADLISLVDRWHSTHNLSLQKGFIDPTLNGVEWGGSMNVWYSLKSFKYEALTLRSKIIICMKYLSSIAFFADCRCTSVNASSSKWCSEGTFLWKWKELIFAHCTVCHLRGEPRFHQEKPRTGCQICYTAHAPFARSLVMKRNDRTIR